jgi:hypothetical protein
MWNNIYTREVQHDRFPFYKAIVGSAENKTVMDFGGNTGNLLHFSAGEIKEENFICVDLDETALSVGETEYPNAKWLSHDRYGWCYNHHGNRNASFPSPGIDHIDHIFSYSVFSHTDFAELVTSLKWMKTFNPEIIAVSVLLTENKVIADWFWHRRVQEYGRCIDYRDHLRDCQTTFSVFDNDFIVEDTPLMADYHSRHLITFHRQEWLLAELAKEGLEAELVQPPHCYQTFVVIRNS